jgi:lipid-A-disaccharide synthase
MKSISSPKPVLFMIAGEASGDWIGSTLIHSLRQQYPHLSYSGIGGPLMEAAGEFTSMVPIQTLSHMGLWFILKNLRSLMRLLTETATQIQNMNPTGLLTIDSPEFCLRVSGRIRGIPRIHCVPPAVWAWRSGRAKHLQKYTDLVLSLFPFERPYFQHMPYGFLGHPVTEMPRGNAQRFWESLGESPSPLLCVLPGSRVREVTDFLPVFMETAQRVRQEIPHTRIVIPTLPSFYQHIQALAPDCIVMADEEKKKDALAASTVALAASGSVTLELARQQVPMVVGYKVPKVTQWIVQSLIKTPCVALINIVAGRPFVPECLQDRFTPDVMAREVIQLFKDPVARHTQVDIASAAIDSLRGEVPFSQGGAQAVGSFLNLSS